MKKIAYVIFSVAVVSLFGVSSASAEGKKAETTQAAAAKISKADAQRLVLQKSPGANVVNVNEATVGGRKVWVVSYTATGANLAKKAFVDQETGKITK